MSCLIYAHFFSVCVDCAFFELRDLEAVIFYWDRESDNIHSTRLLLIYIFKDTFTRRLSFVASWMPTNYYNFIWAVVVWLTLCVCSMNIEKFRYIFSKLLYFVVNLIMKSSLKVKQKQNLNHIHGVLSHTKLNNQNWMHQQIGESQYLGLVYVR